jgi:uncharacterized protein (TIGR02996 family)
MLDTGSQLYRAIIENPFDDAPRLVYADWLDDAGESVRARFVRDQVRRQGGYPAPYPIRDRGRLADLADTAVWSWAIRRVSVPSRVRVHNTGLTWVEWHRGLVGGCRTPISEFKVGAARLFTKHPVTEVDLLVRPLQQYANGPWRVEVGWRGHAVDRMVGGGLAGSFESYEAAASALNRRLVNYGRKLAGLDPIPDDKWPPPTPPRTTMTSPSPSSPGSSVIRIPPSLTPASGSA